MGPLGVVGAPGSAFPPAIDQMALHEGCFLPRAAGRPRAAPARAGRLRRLGGAPSPRRPRSPPGGPCGMVDGSADGPLRGPRRARGDQGGGQGPRAGRPGTGRPRPARRGHLHRLRHPCVDVLVARALGCAPDTRRLLIGHAGCHAALVGLGVVAVLPTSSGPTKRPGLLATASTSRLDEAELLTWTVTDRGFRMGLSRRSPRRWARRWARRSARSSRSSCPPSASPRARWPVGRSTREALGCSTPSTRPCWWRPDPTGPEPTGPEPTGAGADGRWSRRALSRRAPAQGPAPDPSRAGPPGLPATTPATQGIAAGSSRS